MAGHFILKSISQSDLNVATGAPLQAHWSNLQHGEVGWTQESEATLTNALSGNAIGNRNTLPPHRYLMVNGGPDDNAIKFLRGAGWADSLVRPSSDGLGLVALCPQATIEWNAGRKNEALVAQALHGNVSIEVYYQSGYKIG